MSVSSENAQQWAPAPAGGGQLFIKLETQHSRRRGLKGRALGESVNDAKANYPFLHSSFGQCVSVLQIIDFYVLDKIAILLEDLARGVAFRVDGRRPNDWRTGRLRWGQREVCLGRLSSTYSANRRHVDMLNALLRLDLRVDPRSRGRRLRSSVRGFRLFGLGDCGAACVFARNRAARARATRVRLPARGRPRPRAAIKARARRAVGLGLVEARALTRAVRHGCGAASSVGAARWCWSVEAQSKRRGFVRKRGKESRAGAKAS